MYQIIIAMLVIGLGLILRDMAKIIFWGRKQAQASLYEEHPQKERIEKYAGSFQKLANTFYSMPVHEDRLSTEETEEIFERLQTGICGRCARQAVCWKNRYFLTYRRGCEILAAMQDGDGEKLQSVQGELAGECLNGQRFMEAIRDQYLRARQNMMWNNRMIENRLAVAEQLNEVAHLMKRMAEEIYDITGVPRAMEEKVRKALRKEQVILKRMWTMDKPGEKKRYFLTMRARSGQCVTLRELEKKLSDLCGCPLVAEKDRRTILNGEYTTVLFTEDVNYKVLYGVARITKEEEMVSGDNYACACENGQFVICLSDGMGSGLEASRESETVVELLEQFITSGFSRETAARMINSALVLQRGDGRFSTVDICSLDLYTGVCSFLKAGAASTFIRRDQWVETIASTSIGAGLMQQMDYDITSKKLYDGDYLVMLTDGVLDALPIHQEEETMREILLQVHGSSPKEIGRNILERVLSYSSYHAADDMTVLVAGIWKK